MVLSGRVLSNMAKKRRSGCKIVGRGKKARCMCNGKFAKRTRSWTRKGFDEGYQKAIADYKIKYPCAVYEDELIMNPRLAHVKGL